MSSYGKLKKMDSSIAPLAKYQNEVLYSQQVMTDLLPKQQRVVVAKNIFVERSKLIYMFHTLKDLGHT
jgi:hypothetical protein